MLQRLNILSDVNLLILPEQFLLKEEVQGGGDSPPGQDLTPDNPS